MADNLTVPGGKLYFDRFLDGTTTKTGERYMGNSQSASVGSSVNKIACYSNEDGLAEKVDETTLRVDRTFKMKLRNIDDDNLALGLLGIVETVTQASGTVTAEKHNDVIPGLYYQLGVSAGQPSGVRKVSSVVVKPSGGGTAFTVTADYTVDADLGRLYIVPGGAITSGTDLDVDYAVAAKSWKRIKSTGVQAQGALRVIADNAKGANKDYYFPKVNLSPTGEYVIKSDPESPSYAEIELEVEVLKLDDSTEALYVDGRPA